MQKTIADLTLVTWLCRQDRHPIRKDNVKIPAFVLIHSECII